MSPQKTLFFGSQNPNSTIYSDTSNGNDRKHRTYIKAELVRKELLSRGDLIRLYQPPIPKSQLPTSNPFYTKTIVVRPSPYSPAAPISTTAGTLTGNHRRQITTTFSPNRVGGPYENTMSPNERNKTIESAWSGNSYAARTTIQSA